MSLSLLQQNKSRSSSQSSSRASSVASVVNAPGEDHRPKQQKQVKNVRETGLTYDNIRDKVLAKMKRDKNGRIEGNASVKALVDMYDACEKEGYDTRRFVPLLRQICHLVATGAKIPELYDEVSIDNGLVGVIDDNERARYDAARDELIAAVVEMIGLKPDNKVLEFGRADKSGQKQTRTPSDFVRDVLSGMEMDMSAKAHRHGPAKMDPILSKVLADRRLSGTGFSLKAISCALKSYLKNAGVRLSVSKESNATAFDRINANRRAKKGTSGMASDKKEMNTLSYTVIKSGSSGIIAELHKRLKEDKTEAFAKLRTQSDSTHQELQGTGLVGSGDFVFNVVAEDRIALALALSQGPLQKLSFGEFLASTKVCLHFDADKVLREKEKQAQKKTGVMPSSSRPVFDRNGPSTPYVPRGQQQQQPRTQSANDRVAAQPVQGTKKVGNNFLTNNKSESPSPRNGNGSRETSLERSQGM